MARSPARPGSPEQRSCRSGVEARFWLAGVPDSPARKSVYENSNCGFAVGTKSAILSRVAASEFNPRRKPWVQVENDRAP